MGKNIEKEMLNSKLQIMMKEERKQQIEKLLHGS